MENYEVEIFKQVNLAKDFFFAYNKKIEGHQQKPVFSQR